MDSAQNKKNIIVGIFVIISLIIFIAGVMTLGGQQKTFTNTITVHALFDDVNGLLPGNNVWLSGVKVGTVKKMTLSTNGKVAVQMSIEEQNRAFIPHDAVAKIGTDGLIGNKIIVIGGGTAGTAPVSDGGNLVIHKEMDIKDLMLTLQASGENLQSITADFKRISNGIAEGQGTVGKLLNDETIANELEATLSTFKKTALKVEELAGHVAWYTSKLQSKGTLANDLVSDTTIFNSLQNTASQIEAASKMTTQVITELRSTTQSLNKKDGSVGLLLNDKETADQLKQTIMNLQSGTQKLNENMEALQHNFLLRGFFRKKAKVETGEQYQPGKAL